MSAMTILMLLIFSKEAIIPVNHRLDIDMEGNGTVDLVAENDGAWVRLTISDGSGFFKARIQDDKIIIVSEISMPLEKLAGYMKMTADSVTDGNLTIWRKDETVTISGPNIRTAPILKLSPIK